MRAGVTRWTELYGRLDRQPAPATQRGPTLPIFARLAAGSRSREGRLSIHDGPPFCNRHAGSLHHVACSSSLRPGRLLLRVGATPSGRLLLCGDGRWTHMAGGWPVDRSPPMVGPDRSSSYLATACQQRVGGGRHTRSIPRSPRSPVVIRRAPSSCPPGRTGWPDTSPSARRRRPYEAAGHRRRRVHRLELRAPRPDEHEVRVLDKLTYAGRRENLPEDGRAPRRRDRGPARRARGDGGLRRGRQLRRRDPRRPLDRRPGRLRPHPRGRHRRPARRGARAGVGRYLQVSTDEVYGSIETGSFTETSPLDPSSPYSATKAAGDLLVSAHVHTYGLEAVICRGSNNYGPRQYPEKLIPLMVLNALHGDSLPVYGDGRQVRNWLYVEDFCRGIHTVLMNGRARRGLQRRRPRRVREHRRRQAGDRADRRRRVADRVRQDRPGHDRRYSLSPRRSAPSSAGRRRSTSRRASSAPFSWYRDNEEWWAPIRSGEYREYYEKQYGKAPSG